MINSEVATISRILQASISPICFAKPGIAQSLCSGFCVIIMRDASTTAAVARWTTGNSSYSHFPWCSPKFLVSIFPEATLQGCRLLRASLHYSTMCVDQITLYRSTGLFMVRERKLLWLFFIKITRSNCFITRSVLLWSSSLIFLFILLRKKIAWSLCRESLSWASKNCFYYLG